MQKKVKQCNFKSTCKPKQMTAQTALKMPLNKAAQWYQDNAAGKKPRGQEQTKNAKEHSPPRRSPGKSPGLKKVRAGTSEGRTSSALMPPPLVPALSDVTQTHANMASANTAPLNVAPMNMAPVNIAPAGLWPSLQHEVGRYPIVTTPGQGIVPLPVWPQQSALQSISRDWQSYQGVHESRLHQGGFLHSSSWPYNWCDLYSRSYNLKCCSTHQSVHLP